MIKSLIVSLIIALTLSQHVQSEEFTVNRVLPISSFEVTSEKPFFTLWREVCANKDTVVEVFKDFTNSEGKHFRDPNKADYGFLEIDGCKSDKYNVVVPSYIPNGEYLYKPLARINGGSVLIELPTERVIINRNN